MEAVKQWFQDWSDACEYARECAPDFASFPRPVVGEPYTALLAIAAGCFLVWAWNEWRIRELHAHEAHAPAVAGGGGDLQVMLDEMKDAPVAAKKLAA